MPLLVITPRKLTIGGLVLVAGIAGSVWYFDPDRQLERNWRGLLAAVEARKAVVVGRFIAQDYGDRWGYSRTGLLEDARLAFLQMQQLEVTAENVAITRTSDTATIQAIIRIDTFGQPNVTEARTAVNALFTPFVFEWRRDSTFPWRWRLVRLDHPEINLRRFRHGAGF